MKILLISSGVLTIPPSGYGGLEKVIFDLAVELDQLGHEVSVVGPTGSRFPGNIKLIDCGPCNQNAHVWEEQAYGKYKDSLKDYDVIHDHSWRKFPYLAKMENPKLNVCATLHGMLPYHSSPPVGKPCFIGISKDHADRISAGLGIPCRVAYNGIDLSKYHMNGSKRNNRYLFLARITPFKGAHTFIDALNQIKGEGDVVGDDTLVEDRNYVERILMACNSNPNIRYWGGVSRAHAIEFFQKSRCYILPNNPGWEEPFGLTVVEAMACGCPVVATKSGAIPELIDEGKTGYVAKSLQDIPGILTGGEVEKIKAEDCRAQAEKFSRTNMALKYVELYEECIAKGW